MKKRVNFNSPRTGPNGGVSTLTVPAHPLWSPTSRGWFGDCFLLGCQFLDIEISMIPLALRYPWFPFIFTIANLQINHDQSMSCFFHHFNSENPVFWPRTDDASSCAAS